MTVCVDLAGVEKAAIDLRVEPLRLVIQGIRPPPEPVEKDLPDLPSEARNSLDLKLVETVDEVLEAALESTLQTAAKE